MTGWKERCNLLIVTSNLDFFARQCFGNDALAVCNIFWKLKCCCQDISVILVREVRIKWNRGLEWLDFHQLPQQHLRKYVCFDIQESWDIPVPNLIPTSLMRITSSIIYQYDGVRHVFIHLVQVVHCKAHNIPLKYYRYDIILIFPPTKRKQPSLMENIWTYDINSFFVFEGATHAIQWTTYTKLRQRLIKQYMSTLHTQKLKIETLLWPGEAKMIITTPTDPLENITLCNVINKVICNASFE